MDIDCQVAIHKEGSNLILPIYTSFRYQYPHKNWLLIMNLISANQVGKKILCYFHFISLIVNKAYHLSKYLLAIYSSSVNFFFTYLVHFFFLLGGLIFHIDFCLTFHIDFKKPFSEYFFPSCLYCIYCIIVSSSPSNFEYGFSNCVEVNIYELKSLILFLSNLTVMCFFLKKNSHYNNWKIAL